jgi:hypothetical protein
MQPVYSSIEKNDNTREPVSILPLIKQRTNYYACTAGVASRKTSSMISINHAWTSWYGFLLPNSSRRTIENSIEQRTSPRTSLLEETIQMQWRKFVNAIITTPVNDKYRPDPKRWVCICPAFVRSRCLICKHLIQVVQPVVFHPSKKESYATFLGTSNPHPRNTTSDNTITQIPSKHKDHQAADIDAR